MKKNKENAIESDSAMIMASIMGVTALLFLLVTSISSGKNLTNPAPEITPVVQTQVTATPTNIPIVTKAPPAAITRSVTKYVAKYDGTRTGNIVSYYSYCEKKYVNIYENEMVPYTRKTGQQIYSTKSDIVCYERDFGSYGSQQPPANSGTTNRVSWTSTEGIVDGTYYCNPSRVNELTWAESTIKLKMAVADSCRLGATPARDTCTTACNTSPDYAKCIAPCWDAYTNACIGLDKEIGVLRGDLMKKISEVCP